MNNRFIIITVSNNNEKWVEENINSILSQDYSNYKMIYFDNWSTDKTAELAAKYLPDDGRFKLYQDSEHIYKTGFFYKLDKITEIEDNDILVFLDGDDMFSCENVLSYLNEVYNKTQCWMTYGGMVVWNGGENLVEPFPQNSEIPFQVKLNKEYRKDMWRTSHLKSMRGFVWKSINKEDLKPLGKFEISPDDLIIMYAALELCPHDKIHRLEDSLYLFNNSPESRFRRENTDKSVQPNTEHLQEIERTVRGRKKYDELSIVCPTLAGGLGNQMFEIAAAASLAKDNNAIVVINPNEHILPNQGLNVNAYTDNVLSKILLDKNPKVKRFYSWDKPTYKPIPFQPDLKLGGHYQSYKYFDHNKNYIKSLFSANQEVNKNLLSKYSHIFFGKTNDSGEHVNTNKIAGVQVRRGDYIKFPDHHPMLKPEYYKSAIDLIKPEQILVFSDDIQWCKENLKFDCDKVHYIKDEDYIELYLLSRCHNIVISNSSFGWWAAYLNNHTIPANIYVPSIWFGPSVIQEGFVYDDLIPKEWNRI